MEYVISSEKLTGAKDTRKQLVVATGLALLLSGCSSTAYNSTQRTHQTSVADRYNFDYIYGRGGTSQCLSNSAYNSAVVVVTDKGDNQIEVTPRDSNLHSLEFTGFKDTSKPLQAEDAYTRQILGSYGCSTEVDGAVSWKYFRD